MIDKTKLSNLNVDLFEEIIRRQPEWQQDDWQGYDSGGESIFEIIIPCHVLTNPPFCC